MFIETNREIKGATPSGVECPAHMDISINMRCRRHRFTPAFRASFVFLDAAHDVAAGS